MFDAKTRGVAVVFYSVSSLLLLRISLMRSNDCKPVCRCWRPNSRECFLIADHCQVSSSDPLQGPLIGAAVTESYLGWRWTQYLVCIYTAAVFLIGLFFLDETYAPVILSRRAQKLRLKTKNWALHSQLETQDLSFLHFLEKNVIRALKMLFTEPILLAVCLFNAFCYGVVSVETWLWSALLTVFNVFKLYLLFEVRCCYL